MANEGRTWRLPCFLATQMQEIVENNIVPRLPTLQVSRKQVEVESSKILVLGMTKKQ